MLYNADEPISVGVAISTTGDAHRLAFLESNTLRWVSAFAEGTPIFVTVDGDQEAAERAASVLRESPLSILHKIPVVRVGAAGEGREVREGRQGVAVNKNTGLSLLMDSGVEHLFLSDDDSGPLQSAAWQEMVAMAENHDILHSMVCWGRSRLLPNSRPELRNCSVWSWPRGAVMYVHRDVVETVGGFVEAFGPGGHEHVEWSNRIHRAGFTPAPYCAPVSCESLHGKGARKLWHCADMQKLGEPFGDFRFRKRRITSVRRLDGDWEKINALMESLEGHLDFVPYYEAPNGRGSATLVPVSDSRGAGGHS